MTKYACEFCGEEMAYDGHDDEACERQRIIASLERIEVLLAKKGELAEEGELPCHRSKKMLY